jgi:cell division septation protein DedD
MLRWVVLILLLGNGIYFAWQGYLAPPRADAAVAVVDPQGTRVVLLSENKGAAPAVKRPAAIGSAAASTSSAPTSAVPQPVTAGAPPEVPSAPICHMIGPFHERISARQVRDRLLGVPFKVDLYQVNVPAKPVYWVYLGPMRSRQEAQDQHRQLLTKNIESFIITEGPLLNGVSLGFFTREESAQTLLRQRREQGYEAKLREVARTNPEMWVVFGDGEFSRFDDAQWQKARAGTDGIEVRKSLCDVVASAEKLE